MRALALRLVTLLFWTLPVLACTVRTHSYKQCALCVHIIQHPLYCILQHKHKQYSKLYPLQITQKLPAAYSFLVVINSNLSLKNYVLIQECI